MAPHRRPGPTRLLATAALPTLLLVAPLAGCADAPAQSGGGTTSATVLAAGDFAKITVTPGKDAKTAPTIALASKPFRVKDTQHRVLTPGTGAAIADTSIVTANWARFSGVDGAPMGSSHGGQPASIEMGKDTATVPGFVEVLKGQKVGTRALVALPASKILNEAQLAKGMTLDDTVLYVIEVTGAQPVLEKATGAAVPPKAGLPTVEVPEDTKQPAKVTVPGPTPLKETLLQPLITGTGPKVAKGQTVRVRYTGTTWRAPNEPFDYSGKSPKTTVDFPIGAGRLIKAWDNLIPGQTVGSRLLLVVQPADGYGPEGDGSKIKGDDVLIFVMDILGAWN